MNDTPICICEEWALKLRLDSNFEHLAITFNCPKHGIVTLDDRPIPIPRLPPYPRRNPPGMRSGGSGDDTRTFALPRPAVREEKGAGKETVGFVARPQSQNSGE